MTKAYSYCPLCASEMAAREQPDGTSRHACTACDFVQYDNPTPVVAAIVERGDEVVLVRNVGWPETWYGLVTGFLERGESPEEGILREVREELGLEATLESFVGLYTFTQMNQLIIAYHVKVADRAPITPDPVEIADYKLVPIHKLKPWPMGTGEAVKAWLATRHTHPTQE
jgi:NAD+ diphosphatase